MDKRVDRVRRVRERVVSRWAVGVAIALTVMIAAVAFMLSFASLLDLAVRAGIPGHLAWGWPVIVDGMIVGATVSLVAMSGHEPAARRYPWTVLAIGAVVSVSGNVAHAVWGTTTREVPVLIAAAVSAFAPIALLIFTHLTITVTRKAAPRPARPVPSPAPAPEPLPVTTAEEPETPPDTAARPALHLAASPDPVSDLDSWYRAREAAGTETTGADVAKFLGVSPATGRRRLAALRAAAS